MNVLQLAPVIVSSLSIEGVEFRDCVMIDLKVDGESLTARPELEGCLPVFSSLLDSTKGSGRFLIFTCACGTADDAGLSGVMVTHLEDQVTWMGDGLEFVFELKNYKHAISSCFAQLEPLLVKYELEPSAVIYPEGWS